MHFLVEIAGGRPQNVRTIGEFSRLSPNIRIYSKTIIIPWLLQHFRHWSPNVIKVKQIDDLVCATNEVGIILSASSDVFDFIDLLNLEELTNPHDLSEAGGEVVL